MALKKASISKQALACFVQHANQMVPVPIIQIANTMDIKVHEATLDPTELGQTPSGILTKEDERWLIIVNATDSPTQKRFSIAHALGHFVLHRHTDEEAEDVFIADATFFKSPHDTLADTDRETEANYFAACLLVPEVPLREYWQETPDLSLAAEHFSVSELTLTYRLKDTELITFI